MWFKSSFTTPAVAALCFCSIGGTTPAYADLGDQLFKLLADDGAVGDRFGFSVGISGTTAVVGALEDDNNGASSGSAYLFDTTFDRPTLTCSQVCRTGPRKRHVPGHSTRSGIRRSPSTLPG